MISALQLARFAPACPAEQLAVAAVALDAAAARFAIVTPRQVRHWMAIIHVETGGLTRLEENLNYSAERLVQVWPGRFPTLKAAAPYAHNPRALANKVYGGRGGNTGPNDGWLYRGSGPAQLTFRGNFVLAGKALGLDLEANPAQARSWPIGALVAGWFWASHGLNAIVAPDPAEQICATLAQTITRNEFDDARDARHVWNGGETGLGQVREQLLRAAEIWPD